MAKGAMSSRPSRRVRAIALGPVAVACGLAFASAAEPVLVVNPQDVVVGQSFTGRVEGAAAGAAVKWSVNDRARIARADSWKREAVFLALKPGRAEVTAAIGGRRMSVEVPVGSPPDPGGRPDGKSGGGKASGPPGGRTVTEAPAGDGAGSVSVNRGTETVLGGEVDRGGAMPPKGEVEGGSTSVAVGGSGVKVGGGTVVVSPDPGVKPGGADGDGMGEDRLTPDTFRLPQLPVPEASIPAPIELDRLDMVMWAGCVSAAREAMRLVYGEMTPEEEKKFEARWKSYLEYPCKEVVDYFNKLNPLLAQFLAFRRAAAQTLLAIDHAQYDAAHLVAYKDLAGFAERMRGLAMLRAHLASLIKALELLCAEIEALGEPPDAAAAQEAARRRHRDAMALFAGGSGLEGEWAGTHRREKIEGDMSVGDSVANILLTGSVLDAIKKAAEEKMTPEEREKKRLGEKQKEEAWASGKPLSPEMAERFPVRLLFSRAEDSDGNEVYHLYNFQPSEPKREDYEKSGRLKRYEFDRAECGQWMGARNFVWPPFDEGMDFWSLEHESRNPSDWRDRWNWEFDVEGDALTITEKGYYADDRTDMSGSKSLGGKMRSHRVWELRRVARDPRLARPGDWSVEAAVRPIRHPSSAWVLKGAKVKPTEGPIPEGDSVVVAPDGLSATITHTEKRWVASGGGGGGQNVILPSDVEEVGGGGSYKIVTYVSRHGLAKAPPEKLRPGDSFELEATVAVEPPPEKDRGFLRASTLVTDWFTREGLVGATKSADADEEKGTLVASVKHRCPAIPDWPYEPGQTIPVTMLGRSYGEVGVEFAYEAVPMELADQVDAVRTVEGAGTRAGLPEGLDPAQAEQVKFHETNIEYFKREVVRLEGDLRGAPDPNAAEELKRRLLYAKDAMQRELDQIQYIKTGEYVRTRTEADDFNQRLMAEQSRLMADHFGTLFRVIERMPRLIATAPPGERDALRKRFFEVVNSKSIASGDIGDIRKVADEIGERIGGIRRRELEKAENEAWWADAKVTALEVTKGAADFSLMVCASIAFAPALAASATSLELAAAAKGIALYTGYAAFTTGYMDGNPAGAVRQVLTGITMTGALADQMIQGYQQGVVGAYEQYARDVVKANVPGAKPGAGPGPVDEVSAGWSSAAWEAGKTALLMGAMKLGIHWLCGSPPTRPRFEISGGRSAKNFKGGTQMAGWQTIDDFTQMEAFQRAQAAGRIRAQEFQEISEQYWALHNRLRAGGASLRDLAGNAELRIMQRRMTEAYSRVKVDYHAKMMLNQSGNTTAISHFNKIDTMQMEKVRARLAERMQQQGYSRQEYKLFSNSASSGRAPIDVNLGAVEPRGNAPAFGQWLRGLTRTEGGRVTRISLQEFRQAGQRNLRGAFNEVMGVDMDEPFLLFTHSRHPEAYKDLAWLGSDRVRHVVVDGIEAGWTGQAASVTRFKIDELRDLAGMDCYTKLQESCRGMVKDFDTKLAPLLSRAKNPEASRHMGELYEVMRQFSRNEIGPMEADRRIRMLTGGRGVAEVAERFRMMLEGLAGNARVR